MSVASAFDRAWSYAEDRSFEGIDPYDALSSPLLAALHRVGGRPFGILATQVLRRMPWDVRPALGIRAAANPKGLALFLSAAARVGSLDVVPRLAGSLRRLSSGGGWGYPFPWRSRAFYLPARTPTIVATAFVGEAFVDAYRATGDHTLLDTAVTACAFLDRLHRTEDATGACLSYSTLDRSAVYNASLLGGRLLVRVGTATGDAELVERARPLVAFALARQTDDGAWAYGDAAHHRWIDSFHTGFVLSALEVWREATGDPDAARAIDRGFRFYADTFFGPEGEPYYFSDRKWPHDVHSAAQAVLTGCQLREAIPGAESLARRAGHDLVERFLCPDGHFRYQIRRTHRVDIPYMRWSQAWAVRALAELTALGIEPR